MSRTVLVFLALLSGVFLLAYHERFPVWFHYLMMLTVLGITRWQMPEWFESAALRALWTAGVVVMGVGLALEVLWPGGLSG